MYTYLKYKSAATIGLWWNLSNHSGNIQIDTVTNKGNNLNLLCDYITQCNYHCSYFPQSLNCSRGHYFTAVDYPNCTELIVKLILKTIAVTQCLTEQWQTSLSLAFAKSHLFTIEKVPTDILYSNKWVIYNIYCKSQMLNHHHKIC